MISGLVRSGGRGLDQLRRLNITYDVFNYAAGSVLFELGNTKVLCAISMQQGVPHFLRGKKAGWLTAEYSLLPASTPIRTIRESTANKRSGRNIEISRLIGRSLRSIVDLSHIGENTIFVDCDVLQADGGTRTACITGAFIALKAAVDKWIYNGIIKNSIIKDELAAVSVGITRGKSMLDLDFIEDSATQADFNFVLTRSGKIVEIQGAAEQSPISWDQYSVIKSLAIKGANDLFNYLDNNPYIFVPCQSVPESIKHSYFESSLD